jgi:hypothetical protein
MSRISMPSSEEKDIGQELRSRVIQEIQRRQLTNEELAKILDILPSGATVLLGRSEWPVEMGLRVASALSLSFELKPVSR